MRTEKPKSPLFLFLTLWLNVVRERPLQDGRLPFLYVCLQKPVKGPSPNKGDLLHFSGMEWTA